MIYMLLSTRAPALAVYALLSLTQVGSANSLHPQTQTLTLPTNPSLVLRIDPMFHPLQPLAFPIESLTNVDRRVFVDSDRNGVIRRLVIVQFETVQPGTNFRFAYPSRPPADFGTKTYRFGAYVHDDEAEAERSPAKEAGKTRDLLLAKGFNVPKVFRVARLARVADQNGMTEVIIFYMEAADADFPVRPLPGADEDGDVTLDEAGARSLLDRLKSVVTPVSG
jgi:hypothetical protein